MKGEMVPDMGREGHLHRAVFNRQSELRSKCPGSEISIHIDDIYPRAVIVVEKDGMTVREEFFESASSVSDRDDDYVEALIRSKSIGIHYPSMSFDGTAVVEKVTDVRVKAGERKLKGPLTVDGYLYDFYGNEEQVA